MRVTYLYGLAGTSVDVAAPAPGRAQSPIYPLVVGSHGAWLEVRSSPSDGGCGVSGYPCRHPGVDVAGARGTTVVAPESGTIVMVADGNSAPFGGYGPWLIVIRGVSGKYHLLGHLDPSAASMGPMGAHVRAGDQIGVTSSANHTHWEVRSKLVPDFARGESNFTNNTDPLAWLARASLMFPMLIAGGGAVLVYLIARRRSHG